MYKTTVMQGRLHVIRQIGERQGYPLPNFNGTGQALCGLLKKGETLDQWRKRLEGRLKE